MFKAFIESRIKYKSVGEYCPKCKSRLYPLDQEYMLKYGICSYCKTFVSEKKDSDVNTI